MGLRWWVPVEGGGRYLCEWDRGYLQVGEQWSHWLHPRRYNWLDVRLLHLSVEWTRYTGGSWDLDIGVLGFNVFLTHHFGADNGAMQDALDAAREIHEGRVPGRDA